MLHFRFDTWFYCVIIPVIILRNWDFYVCFQSRSPSALPKPLFSVLGPLSLALSHSNSHTHTLSLPFYCVCCFFGGVDVVQIAVANRDSLSSPPVARHSIHKQIKLWTSELLPRNNKQNLICILKFSPLCLFSTLAVFFFLKTSLSYVWLHSGSLFPPSLPLSSSLSARSQLQQGRTTDRHSLALCESVRKGVCMCVCVHSFWVLGRLFFSNVRESWVRDPYGAVIWLNKQLGSVWYLLQQTPGTAEINLRLWTSEGIYTFEATAPVEATSGTVLLWFPSVSRQPSWPEREKTDLCFSVKVRGVTSLTLSKISVSHGCFVAV